MFKGISCETAVNTNRLVRYMEDICSLADDRAEPGVEELSLSILRTAILLLLHVIRKRDLAGEGGKAAACRTIVAGSMTDPSLSVKKIAATMKCSPDYLSHAFHIETGMRLTEYLNGQRMELAKGLLDASMLSVKEIAWACGYADPGYFTRVFRKRMRVSPRGYRKKP